MGEDDLNTTDSLASLLYFQFLICMKELKLVFEFDQWELQRVKNKIFLPSSDFSHWMLGCHVVFESIFLCCFVATFITCMSDPIMLGLCVKL